MKSATIGKRQVSDLYPSHRIHRALPGPDTLTPEHIEAFKQTGFVAVENVFTPQEVQAAKAGLTHLITGGNPAFDGVQLEMTASEKKLPAHERELFVRKIMHFVEFDARLKAMSSHPILLSIVKRLIGSDVTLTQDMALLKPPHVGTEKPWHQDMAYFLLDPPQLVLGTWTALDEATPENGCMHIIPGSHLLGPQPHYHDRDCQIADEEVDVDRTVVIPLKPGGVLFFSGLLHHGTPPNDSPSRRRALQFHYASVNCKKMDATEHKELFHEEGEYAGCAAYADPSKLKVRPIGDRRTT